MKIEHKVVPVVETKVIDEAQGIVGAFVSVTGVVDSVKDRIIPGAYQSTLKSRTPKGVWSHDWDTPVSKTLSAEELLPGDDRLPTKTRDGEEWPATAGALYVETQFNLGTTRGKDAFSDVVFFGDQQEWSIGYNVPPGGSKMDAKTGVREITYIDLFEYSPVLFGAMPLTTTAGVKDAQEAWKAAVAEGRVEPGQVTEEERKDGDPAAVPVVPVVPVAADPADAGALPTTDGLVDASQVQVTTPADPQHVGDQNPPAGTGTDAGVVVEPRPTVEGPAGQAEVNPAKAGQADEVKFVVRLTTEAEEKVRTIQADAAKSLAVPGADAAVIFAAVQEQTKAILDDQGNYVVAAAGSEEAKAEVTLTGSYEERQQAIRKVLPNAVGDLIDLDDRDEYGYPRFYVTTEATFANRVVAAAYDMQEGGVRYFEASYTFGTDGATIKPAREVRIEAAVTAKGQERAREMKAIQDAMRKAQGIEVPTLTVEEGGVRVHISSMGDSKAVEKEFRAKLLEVVKAAVADIPTADPGEGGGATTGQPEATEAKGAPEGVTVLDEAELLMLERIKLGV